MSKSHVLYLLSYDHGGYVLWGSQFKERIESAISWLDKYPRFKIGLDNEAFAYDKYSEADPEIISIIQDMLHKYEGRFGIGSTTYGQPLSVFINEESNVRQLVYAIRTNLKNFGVTPIVYAISEHALHSQIPQLIKQAGYKGAIMRTHFMMYGYNPTYHEPFGWWIGDDGTKIPAVPTYDGEGAQFGITTFDNWVLTRWPDKTDQSIEQFVEKFRGIHPLLASRYDDIILRCEKLVEHVESIPEYEWAILEDLPDIYGEPKAEFKPSANEFKVRMPWGYCGNKIFNDCREAEISVGIAERVNASAVLAGGHDLQEELELSWKNLLISQHHDIQICGLLGEEKQYITKSLEISRKVLTESLQYISTLFQTGGYHNVVVFNPLSWKSKQMISAEIEFRRGKGVPAVKVVHNGECIPCEVRTLDKKQNKITRAIVSFEAEVDPLTANCYSIEPSESLYSFHQGVSYDPKSGILLTDEYEICLNEKGIRFIRNRKTGVEYVNNSTGSLLRGVINGKDSASSGRWIVHCYPQSAVVVQLGDIGGIAYEFTMVVSNITPGLACNVIFLHHGEKIGTAEKFDSFQDNTNGFVHENKLRFKLTPCIAENAIGIRDLPFLIAATEDKYIQGNYWTAVSDNKVGIAFFNKGAMCSLKEENGYSLPLEYANEYVWGDRYLYGRYSHEFCIYPFEGEWQKADLHKKAIEYQYSFVACEAEAQNNGRFDNSIHFIDIDTSKNVIMSALYPENGSVIARLYEYQGKEGTAKIVSGFGDIRDEVTIMGEHSADIAGNSLLFRKHEIKSIRLDVKAEKKKQSLK